MQAETLNCPNCGAASSTDAPACQFCGFAPRDCCLSVVFRDDVHWQQALSSAAERRRQYLKLRMPRIASVLAARVKWSLVTLGLTTVLECEQCLGLWLDLPSFEKICADREQQSAVLGAASHAPPTLRIKPARLIMYRVRSVRC